MNKLLKKKKLVQYKIIRDYLSFSNMLGHKTIYQTVFWKFNLKFWWGIKKKHPLLFEEQNVFAIPTQSSLDTINHLGILPNLCPIFVNPIHIYFNKPLFKGVS